MEILVLPTSSFIRDVKSAMISPLALLNRRDAVISRDATRGYAILELRTLRWRLVSLNPSSKLWMRGIRLHGSLHGSGNSPIDHAKRICSYGSEGGHCWVEVERIRSLIGLIREGGFKFIVTNQNLFDYR